MTELLEELRHRSFIQVLGYLFPGPRDRSQYAESGRLELAGLSHAGIEIVRQADEPDAGGGGDDQANRRPQDLRSK